MSAVTDLATDVPPATVLIVDDDPLNRAMLSMSLGSLGHQVIEAGNGLEGIAALGAHDVDVVITDIEMPEMDGYGLLEHRAGDDRLKAIPFIVISGVDEMESIITCIKLGAEDYLPKPFDPVLLHARLGACLDKKRMTDELQQWNLLPGRPGRREGRRGRAPQHAAPLRHPAAGRGPGVGRRSDSRQPSPRDHRAVL